MRFGVITLPNEPWPDLVARWRTLDEQGWDAVYVADHLANPYLPEQPWLDGWACLAAMAVVTEHAAIGPLVTPITFRNPAAVARAALTVDAASGGRLVLALGAGGSARDHELAEVERWDPPERAARFEAFVRRVQAVTSDEEIAPRPPNGRIPLVLGGGGPRLIRLAAEVADGWNTYVGSRLSAEEGRERAAEQVAALDTACREAGREPGSIRRSVLLGHSFVAEEPFLSEESFAEVARAWHAIGFDELVVYADPAYMGPREHAPPADAHERIARDVLPGLRDALGSAA